MLKTQEPHVTLGIFDTDPYGFRLNKAGDDVPDGFSYDYGIKWPPNYSPAFRAVDNVLEEADWLLEQVNWQRDSVNVYWPSDDWPQFHYDPYVGLIEHIDLPQDQHLWPPHVVFHEYAHAVMYDIYGAWDFPHYDGPDPHHLGSHSSRGFAFCEGWAEFMECAVWNHDYLSLETNTYYRDCGTDAMDGIFVEGSVASVFWDLQDPISDADRDNAAVGFSSIFAALRNSHATNMDDFWTALIAVWPAVEGPLCSIYYHYGINKDVYSPYDGRLIINNGQQYTASRTLSLLINGYDWGSGVTYMRFSEAFGNWGPWIPYAEIYTYSLATPDDGNKRLDVQFQDAMGLISSPWTVYSGITLDTTLPQGSITINNGNPTYTSTTSVTLYLSYSDSISGVSAVRYSNDGVWDTEQWESASATKSWTLPSGDGTKTVYYQIKDNVGLTNGFTDTIILRSPRPVKLENVRTWYWTSDTTINSIARHDVDADSQWEIITGGNYRDASGHNHAQLCIWNASTATLENVNTWYWGYETYIKVVASADVDMDGKIEIVTAGNYYDGSRDIAQLCVWDGATLAFENVRTWYRNSNTYIESVDVGDIDGDGKIEIVTGGYYNDGSKNVAQLCVWSGAGLALENTKTWYWTDSTYIRSIDCNDADNDGTMEIVTGGSYYDGTRNVAQLCVWSGANLCLKT